MIRGLSIQELFIDIGFVAVGVSSLQLAFNKRIAPGSVPNFYLLVFGLSLIGSVLVLRLLSSRKNSLPLITNVSIAVGASIVIVVLNLFLAVLTGSV